jgi:hypothetical protein
VSVEFPNDNEGLLFALQQAGAEFILVGGMAAIVHGAARVTFDLDVVYKRTSDNYSRLVAALEKFEPYLRGAPPGLPFRWEASTIERGLNFTLSTTLGAIDLLGEIAGGDFEQLEPYAETRHALGVDLRCLRLDKLIEVKRAAGRHKDFEAIAELEALLEERDAQVEERDSQGPKP